VSGHCERDFLCDENGVSLALFAAGISTVAAFLQLFSELDQERSVGKLDLLNQKQRICQARPPDPSYASEKRGALMVEKN
jgi:hypothetical protein